MTKIEKDWLEFLTSLSPLEIEIINDVVNKEITDRTIEEKLREMIDPIAFASAFPIIEMIYGKRFETDEEFFKVLTMEYENAPEKYKESIDRAWVIRQLRSVFMKNPEVMYRLRSELQKTLDKIDEKMKNNK